jgi:hypothetical protein
MFRITEDPSSGILVQCLVKNYMNYSIVSVDLDKVGVVAAYCDCNLLKQREKLDTQLYRIHLNVQTNVTEYGSIYRTQLNLPPLFYLITVTICCHNTDLIHVNGRDRIILVIFSQAFYKAP